VTETNAERLERLQAINYKLQQDIFNLQDENMKFQDQLNYVKKLVESNRVAHQVKCPS
jgi:hypothetical protein